MGIFEDVLLNTKTAVNSIGKKANRVIDVSKLNLAASDIKGELSQKYEILGRITYEEAAAGKDYKKSREEIIKKISELKEQLENINEMIAAAKEKIKCQSCGTYNVKGALFCNKCGEKLDGQENVQDEEKEISPEDAADFAEDNFADDDEWSV